MNIIKVDLLDGRLPIPVVVKDDDALRFRIFLRDMLAAFKRCQDEVEPPHKIDDWGRLTT